MKTKAEKILVIGSWGSGIESRLLNHNPKQINRFVIYQSIEELPTEEEMQHGLEALKRHDNKVDFLLTHSPSTSELILMGGKGLYELDILTDYLEKIKAVCDYERHFFGHMHVNRAINEKDICLYEQIIRMN